MVQITSSALIAFLLVAPSLAIPISTQQEFDARAEELAARDPGFGSIFRKIKKIARPAASIASLVLRDDIPEAYERALDATDFEELAARDPSLKSIFRKIKKVVTKKNIHNAEKKVENVVDRVGKVADLVLREDAADLSERDLEDLEDLLERGFDNEEDIFDRDLSDADFEELAARNPGFGKIFKKLKKIASPKNLGTLAKAASFVIREENELAARDLANIDIDELEARNPGFGKIFKKLKKIASPKNLGTIAKVASFVVREEDQLTERELAQLEELAERDPSFGSWIRKVGHSVGKVVNAKNLGKVANVASYVIREDSDDVFERDYSDFEIDQLD